eukprot:scaffold5.g937.t1
MTSGEEAPRLLDLMPEEVLALCVSLGLTDPRDVASASAATTRLRSICRTARLRLCLPAGPQEGSAPSQEQQRRLQTALAGVCRSFPGTEALDLRGQVLEDGDVQRLLVALPRLASLQLSACKKLTPGVVAPLAARAGTLRMLALQRCYQQRPSALTQLLDAARRPGASLHAVVLSHLNLQAWPATNAGADGEAAAGAPAPAQGHGLSALALLNCSWLTPAGLLAIAEACPNLEALFLGGSTILPEAAAPLPAPEGLVHEAAEAGAAPSAAAARAARARAAARAALAALIAEVRVPGSLACGYAADVAVELATVAALLPRLQLLELSFGMPGVAYLLQLMLAAGRAGAGAPGGAPPLQVLDLCGASAVGQARAWQRRVAREHAARAGGAGDACGGLFPDDARLLLAAAVNCSSGGRHTPLHVAAAEGAHAQVEGLLALGAQLDARDKSGGTPVFAACESGHAPALHALLAAGADATARNSAGEAPLYIASLRGFGGCVDVLLAHFQSHGVRWQDPRFYGDGWTPLHAAAVGGRTAIVERLLDAAGAAAPQLVASPNRYGQNAIHVAARKGPPPLLHALVAAGGADPVAAPDAEGKTAAEIARRNGNGHAWRLLSGAHAASSRFGAQRLHRGTKPTVERPRPADAQRGAQGGQGWVGRRLQQRKAALAGR